MAHLIPHALLAASVILNAALWWLLRRRTADLAASEVREQSLRRDVEYRYATVTPTQAADRHNVALKHAVAKVEAKMIEASADVRSLGPRLASIAEKIREAASSLPPGDLAEEVRRLQGSLEKVVKWACVG